MYKSLKVHFVVPGIGSAFPSIQFRQYFNQIANTEFLKVGDHIKRKVTILPAKKIEDLEKKNIN